MQRDIAHFFYRAIGPVCVINVVVVLVMVPVVIPVGYLKLGGPENRASHTTITWRQEGIPFNIPALTWNISDLLTPNPWNRRLFERHPTGPTGCFKNSGKSDSSIAHHTVSNACTPTLQLASAHLPDLPSHLALPASWVRSCCTCGWSWASVKVASRPYRPGMSCMRYR